jgi:hypothetical protein
MTIEEIRLILQLLEKEKQWIITCKQYYVETPDVLDKVVGATYKERLELIEQVINKLQKLEISLEQCK